MISPPSKIEMTGDLPSKWEFFRDNWKSYAIATKLDQKDKKIVTATLLTVMEKECPLVCRNLPMAGDERQDADAILTKLCEYFELKRNTIYKWYVFNSRSQKPEKGLINSWSNFASLLLLLNLVHLKMKCYVTALSLVYETTVIANDFFEIPH